MKIFKGVRSTAEHIPSIDVNTDTVYVRNNIERIEEVEFSGWEYDEIQYKKDTYIEQINDLGQQVTDREAETLLLGQQVIELELMIMMGGI